MSYWQGKRVCITGGAGMIGSRLVQFLLDENAIVLVLDNHSRGLDCITGADCHYGDAGNLETCLELFGSVDAVFNLAAFVAGVTYNQTHHAEMFFNNINLQTVPALAAAQVGVTSFLQVSSVCVYAEDKQDPCQEEVIGGEPNESNMGYAWAKRMGERTVTWSQIPHAVIVRPANCYGINDYFDERAHVIPALIKKILNDKVIQVNGTGQEVREFLYADDAARGMMLALENGHGVYNIGSNGKNSCTISELVYMLRDILGIDKPVEFVGGQHGDQKRIVNGDRLMQLGWKPEVDLSDGLKRVCEWYQSL